MVVTYILGRYFPCIQHLLKNTNTALSQIWKWISKSKQIQINSSTCKSCMQVPRSSKEKKNLGTWVEIEPTTSYLRCDALPIKVALRSKVVGRYRSASSWWLFTSLMEHPWVTMLSPLALTRCSGHQAQLVEDSSTCMQVPRSFTYSFIFSTFHVNVNNLPSLGFLCPLLSCIHLLNLILHGNR